MDVYVIEFPTWDTYVDGLNTAAKLGEVHSWLHGSKQLIDVTEKQLDAIKERGIPYETSNL